MAGIRKTIEYHNISLAQNELKVVYRILMADNDTDIKLVPAVIIYIIMSPAHVSKEDARVDSLHWST